MQIVVGVDGSRSAHDAEGWAAGAARAVGAELLLVTVVPPDADTQESERLLLGDWSRPVQAARVPFRTEVLIGDPRLVLLDVAASLPTTLVVIGAGDQRWFPALHLGSTSHYLAQHADQPVAVVPAGHEEFVGGHMVVGIDGS
ncbi:MAG TPA: universal stress protein, partial [Acidimicrobiales bacterium]|nr:universal stress protein [Acidimicrobiales bacterium]